MTSETIRATRTIAASADDVFAVLSDPTTHAAIDGTGWVQTPLDPEPLTEVGQLFAMNMYHPNHPDGDYRVMNQVTVFDPPRTITWRPGNPSDDGGLEFGGWTWGYELSSNDEAGTDVTLVYDWSAVPDRVREYIDFPPFGPDHLPDSLDHLAKLAESGAGH